MVLKVKRLHENAILPKRAKKGDAGLDLVATEIKSETSKQITYGTGIAIEIPEGFVGLAFPRSSIRNVGLELSNAVGVIDSGYRGEVQATFNKNGVNDVFYKVGERICQLVIVPLPVVTIKEVDELSETERGEGGFGSTGK